MIRLGIDIGSTTAKGALLDTDNTIIGSIIIPTGGNPATSAEQILTELSAIKQPEKIIATGYGRALASFADKKITEITCHAAGVKFLHPDAKTIIDIGGQDSKAILLGEDKHVLDFAMNDKCAAGTGSFLDAIAAKFSLTQDDLSALHSTNPTPLAITSTCVVFAESELIGLLAKGEKLEDVLYGVHTAIAARVGRLFAQVSGEREIYFSGGVAKNETMRLALEAELEVPVHRAENPQLIGALGAALLA